jgi:hypothetical protein
MVTIFIKTQVGDTLIYRSEDLSLEITFNEIQKTFTIKGIKQNNIPISDFNDLKNQYPELPISINKNKVVILKEYTVNIG